MSDININDIRPEDWINVRQRFSVPKRFEPAIDEVVSGIVGKKIYQRDPRVIKLVVKWKQGKSQNSMEPDNFFQNSAFIKELKEVLGAELK